MHRAPNGAFYRDNYVDQDSNLPLDIPAGIKLFKENPKHAGQSYEDLKLNKREGKIIFPHK
jgi:hypothetical protein